MSFSAIEKILERATGLDSSSIGSSVIQRAVQQRMQLAGLLDVQAYRARLEQDQGELQALIEDVTVPETWFFRDRKPFELLAELVRSAWYPPSADRVLRILSIPCATGEEPYSIAMVLLEMGFDTRSVRIDAVDISKRALARALAGQYRENSFRGDEGQYRQRYFESQGPHHKINEKVRSMVSFWHGNLLDEKFLAGAELYDVIFCRNVMIYFTRSLQEKAICKLNRLLSINGLLFVGHAEAAKVNGELFTSVRRFGTFAFRKRVPDQGKTAAEGCGRPREPVSAAAAYSAPVRAAAKIKRNTVTAKAAVSTLPPESPPDLLLHVRRLADEGQLAEAARLCQCHLEQNVGSAEAYYLLGLIREAQARDLDAGNLFRKAVYLDPHHYEALVHLAALADIQGNSAAAAVYRARASRLRQGGMSGAAENACP